MPRDAVSRTVNVGTVGKNGLITTGEEELLVRVTGVSRLHGALLQGPLETLGRQYRIEMFKGGL